jgi:hypothetical protein
MATTGKQKRKVFFVIGDDLQPSHKMIKVGGGKFIKRTRGFKAKIVNL